MGIVFVLCHAKHALAGLKDLTQLGKAMSKAFVATGQMPRPSGSMLASPAATGTPDSAEVVTRSRFLLHGKPSNTQLGSTLHVWGTLLKQNEELKEYHQNLRNRIQPMLQVDTSDAH